MTAVDATTPVTTRVAIALLAEQVLAAEAAVSPTRGRGLWVTDAGDHEIAGVVAGVGGSGRVDVGLHLIAALPPRPLAPQAERLRGELAAAAERSGLGAELGAIDVDFHDLRPAAGAPVPAQPARSR